MFNDRPPADIFHFSGTGAMSITIAATALSDQSKSPTQQIARITSNSHGLQANSVIYLQGFANSIYNGIKRIVAVDTNIFDISLGRVPFAALTPAGGGAETAKPIVTYNEPWELLGFELHLSAAGGTSENFTVTTDADLGTAFDENLYTQDMETIKDIVQNYAQPRPLNADDLAIFSYTNTNSRTWGLKVIARRKS